MEQKEDPGKVQLKTILKGSAAQAIRPAAISGFKVADFQMTSTARESLEDRLKNEISVLRSQMATLKGDMENLKNKAEHDVKASYDKGVHDGKALGLTEGEKKALKKWDADLKTLQAYVQQTFETVATQQKENFEKIENITSEIALTVAKRIFCEEAAKNPNMILRVIKEAFTFLGQEEKLKIRLNPMDVDSAGKAESFWKPAVSSLKNMEFVFDDAIEKGGCLLESENGSSIDMRVQTLFEHLDEGVRRIYSSQAPAQSA